VELSIRFVFMNCFFHWGRVEFLTESRSIQRSIITLQKVIHRHLEWLSVLYL
jgi:hypothetical protein